MTVKQVATRTGVSVRTLQFYDEIGLLKPTAMTDAGYRLYDEGALEVLQQILFFKELDFTLREIKTILDDPRFDKTAAYKKQRELIRIKRDRLSVLLNRLDKLLQGETSMDFKEFDTSEYFRALAAFKKTHTDKIVNRLGNMENFDAMLDELKLNENEIAQGAVKQYGDMENFTSAMQKSLEDFLENGPKISESEVGGLLAKGEEITRRLTADLCKDAASSDVQTIVDELVSFTNETNRGLDMGENYWPSMAEAYLTDSNYIQATDKKYGNGASKFIGLALKAYFKAR